MQLTNKTYQQNFEYTVGLINKLKKRNSVKLRYKTLVRDGSRSLGGQGYLDDINLVYSFVECCLLQVAHDTLNDDTIAQLCAHVHLHICEAVLKDKSQSEIDEFFECLVASHSSRFIFPMFLDEVA